MADTPKEPNVQSEREAFEAWLIARQKSLGFGVELAPDEWAVRLEDGRYRTALFQDAWDGWQAHAALASRTPIPAQEAERALRAVVAHWDEFGPEHGFDESIDQARRALAGQASTQAPAGPPSQLVVQLLALSKQFGNTPTLFDKGDAMRASLLLVDAAAALAVGVPGNPLCDRTTQPKEQS